VRPADRVAAAFGGFRIEKDPRELPPSGFNPSRDRSGALVRDYQD
jgi:hypothetical protein